MTDFHSLDANHFFFQFARAHTPSLTKSLWSKVQVLANVARSFLKINSIYTTNTLRSDRIIYFICTVAIEYTECRFVLIFRRTRPFNGICKLNLHIPSCLNHCKHTHTLTLVNIHSHTHSSCYFWNLCFY